MRQGVDLLSRSAPLGLSNFPKHGSRGFDLCHLRPDTNRQIYDSTVMARFVRLHYKEGLAISASAEF